MEGEDIMRLRQEIESTTEEANARINQASDAIRTLKDRLSSRHAEHEQWRQETARFRREAVELENENERLALRSERRGNGGAAAEDRQEELRRLRREVEVLGEQKEALLLILDDLYGAAGAGAGTGGLGGKQPQAELKPRLGGGASHSSDLAGMPLGAEPFGAGGRQQSWTNMLPRPSELFASGVLDDT